MKKIFLLIGLSSIVLIALLSAKVASATNVDVSAFESLATARTYVRENNPSYIAYLKEKDGASTILYKSTGQWSIVPDNASVAKISGLACIMIPTGINEAHYYDSMAGYIFSVGFIGKGYDRGNFHSSCTDANGKGIVRVHMGVADIPTAIYMTDIDHGQIIGFTTSTNDANSNNNSFNRIYAPNASDRPYGGNFTDWSGYYRMASRRVACRDANEPDEPVLASHCAAIILLKGSYDVRAEIASAGGKIPFQNNMAQKYQTLTFDPNGGSVSEPNPVPDDSDTTRGRDEAAIWSHGGGAVDASLLREYPQRAGANEYPGKSTVTRPGYKFLGWYSAKNGGSAESDSNGNLSNDLNGATHTMTTDFTVYAHWEVINQWTITPQTSIRNTTRGVTAPHPSEWAAGTADPGPIYAFPNDQIRWTHTATTGSGANDTATNVDSNFTVRHPTTGGATAFTADSTSGDTLVPSGTAKNTPKTLTELFTIPPDAPVGRKYCSNLTVRYASSANNNPATSTAKCVIVKARDWASAGTIEISIGGGAWSNGEVTAEPGSAVKYRYKITRTSGTRDDTIVWTAVESVGWTGDYETGKIGLAADTDGVILNDKISKSHNAPNLKPSDNRYCMQLQWSPQKRTGDTLANNGKSNTVCYTVIGWEIKPDAGATTKISKDPAKAAASFVTGTISGTPDDKMTFRHNLSVSNNNLRKVDINWNTNRNTDATTPLLTTTDKHLAASTFLNQKLAVGTASIDNKDASVTVTQDHVSDTALYCQSLTYSPISQINQLQASQGSSATTTKACFKVPYDYPCNIIDNNNDCPEKKDCDETNPCPDPYNGGAQPGTKVEPTSVDAGSPVKFTYSIGNPKGPTKTRAITYKAVVFVVRNGQPITEYDKYGPYPYLAGLNAAYARANKFGSNAVIARTIIDFPNLPYPNFMTVNVTPGEASGSVVILPSNNSYVDVATSSFDPTVSPLSATIGDKVCSYLVIDNWSVTNSVDAPGVSASNIACATVSKSPQLNLRGADSRSGATQFGKTPLYTGTNPSAPGALDDKYLGGFTGSLSTNALRGSWSQYGLISNGPITHFGSTGYTFDMNKTKACKLLFANSTTGGGSACTGNDSNGSLDVGGKRVITLPKVAETKTYPASASDFPAGSAALSTALGSTTTGGYIIPDLANLGLGSSDIHTYYANNNVLITTTALKKSQHITIVVVPSTINPNATYSVTIAGNITAGASDGTTTYASLKEIPSLTVIANTIYVSGYTANVSPASASINLTREPVTKIFGTYIATGVNAAAANNSTGTFNTCTGQYKYNPNVANPSQSLAGIGSGSPWADGNGLCGQQLAITGAVISKNRPNFWRTFGAGKDDASVPSEILQYTPSNYLTPYALNHDGDSNAWDLVDLRQLPARL